MGTLLASQSNMNRPAFLDTPELCLLPVLLPDNVQHGTSLRTPPEERLPSSSGGDPGYASEPKPGSTSSSSSKVF